MKDVSLIIPVYNAAPFIETTITALFRALPSDAWEIIAVNDGSADGTGEALERLVATFPLLRVVTLERNRGKGYALKMGMREADGAYIAFTDADLPYGVEIFSRMFARMKEERRLGFIYGSRSHPSSNEEEGYGILRKCGRTFFSIVVERAITDDVKDTQCGVKMLSRPFVDIVLAVSCIDRFAFDVELFAIQRAQNFPSEGIPVTLTHRKESSVHILRDTFVMLRDIWKIRRNMKRGRYTQSPKHLST